jgi:NADH-quinone oxidoreductase subunit G
VKERGAPKAVEVDRAMESARADLAKIAAQGAGSLYAVLSPMMACEEAYLLGRLIRSLDPQAVLALGPVPTTGKDDVFHDSTTGKQTFVIKAEKVPNAAGIRRVISMLGGPTAKFDEMTQGQRGDLQKLKGGWIVGGYLSSWAPTQLPEVFSKGYTVVQDVLPSRLTESADVFLPSATWAEKDGCWENFAGKIQPFSAAIAPPDGMKRDGDVYRQMLGETGLYNARAIRGEMGGPFAAVQVEEQNAAAPAMQFVEL